MSAVSEQANIRETEDGDWWVYAWRRPPDFPDWSFSAKYGDGGWECDPGIEGDNYETTKDKLWAAMNELSDMYLKLVEFGKAQGLESSDETSL